ncbi:allantoate amidohydrolase [Massilia antarctica]|uniref:allantoate amidohydrolase n=1 Tax=Massilia antarctica TaxID=2765360 RepID=UPI0006BCCD4F|nr:allantoate amidohydrolase [Massilia sp. H27-R4]MCY0913061.1 allantoate amidohydrolase [Massilia sp. H27-R4]CUI07645.1 N-carbamoyl-L-amino acid hydrolase [Janthinobacterium sp. CG23_2]CUU31431.1 N-carbamoyl-L-amino acid hydrolase [Janthinobacterium sp. CG23_2]
MTTLTDLNSCDAAAFVGTLHGIYEHSPWIPERALSGRPFATVAALKYALQTAVTKASVDEQLGLIRAHPELAGKAAIAGELTQESTNEQAKSGLNLCSAEEYATLHKLNADYNARFGFPFILAVKGPDGNGLTRSAIIETFTRRLKNQRPDEMAECLRQIHRIAELRINDLLTLTPVCGPTVMQWAETIGAWSEADDGLTCSYMTGVHQRTAAQLAEWMRDAGMETYIDAVGNVVGRYLSLDPDAKTLMTGSHYDTVRDGGKYDGRLGILLPIAVVRHLHERGERLPYHLEVVGFAEEEGVRFRSTFLGSNAVIGQFDMALLEQVDGDGMTMLQALTAAGHHPAAIAGIARNPAGLLGFVEVHIEQGPVLLERGLAVGVVTAIAGSSRYLVDLIGLASHAGTTPMNMRKDAAAAAAEIVLLVERRCSGAGSLVGTVGQLQVPNGSVNVIPGHCKLSLDIRAADDAVRHAAVKEILDGIEAICGRRHVEVEIEQIVSAPAAPCAPALMDQLGDAIERAGLPRYDLASGAGHDAMAMAKITDVAMLFTRCGNGGISHNRLETMTGDDAELAAQVLLDFLKNLL